MIDVDQSADPPYLVPMHLREPQSIGPIPVRTFYVLLGVGLLVGAPVATLGRRELGDVVCGWACCHCYLVRRLPLRGWIRRQSMG